MSECEHENTVTETLDKYKGPKKVAEFRVTWCEDCTKELENERV